MTDNLTHLLDRLAEAEEGSRELDAAIWFSACAVAEADAWASIDGKLEKFRAGKAKPLLEEPGGHYSGYMAGAAVGWAAYVLRRTQKNSPDHEGRG